jgi:hypothetical protein
MFGGGGYEDFKKNNKITEDNNDTFDEFVTEILTGGKETTEEKPYVEALKALSEDKINMYYQLIKDVGTLLGMTETFSEPSAIQLSKMDHAVQDKLDLFSAFYKLGEGCNSEIDRIKRNAVTELDELGEAKDTLSLEDNSDTHEFCRDVKAYKLGIDVGRWPNKALAGEIITKIIKITTKNPSFYERITLIKQHFPKKELCNAFKDAEYRLKRNHQMMINL